MKYIHVNTLIKYTIKVLKIIAENNITRMEIETPLQCSLQLSFFPVPTGGTEITIQGSGLSSMESVRIGDVPVTFTNSSDTEIKVVLPPRPAGAYSMQLLGPSGLAVDRWVQEINVFLKRILLHTDINLPVAFR